MHQLGVLKFLSTPSKSLSLLAFRMEIWRPIADAAACASASYDCNCGLVGFTRKAMTITFRTIWLSNASRFPSSTPVKMLTPVTLPPGPLSLRTRPVFEGSSPVENNRN